ncbi:MAG: tyrosine--tRNA ligase [Parcubacteria group bacterium]|nr:tyrosine--tRNA ligase [Parcubacteria group bacterium]
MSRSTTRAARNDDELLTRGVANIEPKEEVRSLFATRHNLRIKFGIDPTAPKLHLGHAVPLRKLRTFQEHGHTAVLIIGDWTARIGDPSGRDETRPALSKEMVEKNASDYLAQAFLILDRGRTEVRYQHEWYDHMGLSDITGLMSGATLQQMLAHETFRRRLDAGHPLGLHELLYPLLQGYDSVAVTPDIEIGGIDQTFNLLMGRTVMGWFGEKPQGIMTFRYLTGTDGKAKMSKSLGNTVNLIDEAKEMSGKLMSVPDSLIGEYYELATATSLTEVRMIIERLHSGGVSPRDVKADLAEAITTLYHGSEQAARAREEFDRVFSRKETPSEVPSIKLGFASGSLVELLVAAKLAPSKSEARRLIIQGGVKVDGRVEKNPFKIIDVSAAPLFQVGPRRFARLTHE